MSDYPEVTIKALKVSSVMAMEGNPFECSVYVDGKRFCKARDYGDGGPINFEPLPKVDYQEKWGLPFQAALDHIDARLEMHHPAETMESITLPMDLELKVGLLVEEEEIWRDIKRNMKKGVLYYDPEKEQFFIHRLNQQLKQEERSEEDLCAYLKRIHPQWVVLNEMSKKQALETWRDPQKALSA
jgi:hypothetical protein